MCIVIWSFNTSKLNISEIIVEKLQEIGNWILPINFIWMKEKMQATFALSGNSGQVSALEKYK